MAMRKSELHSALVRLNDNDLPEDERAQLIEELLSDPESRREFLEHQMLAAALEETFANEAAAEDPRELYRPFPLGISEEPKSIRFPATVWMSAAAAVLLIVGFALSRLITPAPSSEIALAEPPEPTPDFVLTRAIDVTWRRNTQEPRPRVGEAIEHGDLWIDSGIIEVLFASGATVTLEGPGRLKLNSDMKCRLVKGKLAAHCPPSAHGFVVKFPKGNVLDLGTEFAISALPKGKTDVHVLEGEVVVSRTDEEDRVLNEQNVFGKSAVTVGDQIEPITYDETPFVGLKRDRLIESQPIKLQFDLGHRAGLYSGTNSPAHAAGDMLSHEAMWTQITGDQSGGIVMADGNLCPHPIRVDYGHGDGVIDWDATPVDPTGKIWPKAEPFFNTALCQDHRPWDFDLGLRISGLPAGKYRVYGLCRSIRRPTAAYDVSFGVNLDRQVEQPLAMPPMKDLAGRKWEAGLTYAVSEVEVASPNDWVTFITRYSRERSLKTTPNHGRSVLHGLQIVEIRN